MAKLIIELPEQQDQINFNLARWDELISDPALAKVERRIETDRHGHIIMYPVALPSHESYQAWIRSLLLNLAPHGRSLTKCPISTADGIRAADVAWASHERMREVGNRACFPHAPEICVEVMPPGNSQFGIADQAALYFDAGAQEVWICSPTGAVKFMEPGQSRSLRHSRLCPKFPRQIILR